MRIISQDGTVDMPYERMIVQIHPNNEKSIIAYDTLMPDCEFMCMGVYSTPEKALKAMEMLREYHKEYVYTYTCLSGLCATAIFSANTVQNKKIYEEIYDFASIGAFQFPQDNGAKA